MTFKILEVECDTDQQDLNLYQCEWCKKPSETPGLCGKCEEEVLEVNRKRVLLNPLKDKDFCQVCGKSTYGVICSACSQLVEKDEHTHFAVC